MSGAKDRLLQLLRDRAYQEGHFVLSSGRESDYYLDAKLVTFDPEGVDLVGKVFWQAIEPRHVEAVGGLTMGADPIATAVALTAHRAGKGIPAFVIRKTAKKHGLRKWTEGPLPEGARVAIVDDVVTSGGSILDAIQIAEEAGCEIAVVLVLVDRREGGREAIEAKGYRFEAICTIDELRALSGADSRAVAVP